MTEDPLFRDSPNKPSPDGKKPLDGAALALATAALVIAIIALVAAVIVHIYNAVTVYQYLQSLR